MIDSVLANYADQIKDFGYVSESLNRVTSGVSSYI